MSDIIIIAILVLAAGWALTACLRKKGRSGCCGCSCSCGCGCSDSCGKSSSKK